MLQSFLGFARSYGLAGLIALVGLNTLPSNEPDPVDSVDPDIGSISTPAPDPDPDPEPDPDPGTSVEPEVLTARTDCGVYKGSVDEGGAAFKGIPFAAPPTGGNRFRPPQPATCQAPTEVIAATQFAPLCTQLDSFGHPTGQEDCLYLNVWTPDDTFPAQPSRPVIVYVHGGGNLIGGTSMERFGAPVFDGARLATRGDAVVVSVAYRLGALGYLAHPALSEESPDAVSGNYGILDQIAALQWVQRNIDVFGGDPNQVAVVGQSAGASNVCVLIASPKASGLFQAGIIQSGACSQPDLATRITQGQSLVAAAGCAEPTSAACLRSVSADAWAQAAGSNSIVGSGLVSDDIGPSVDGVVLISSPLQAISAGNHNRVRMIVGATAAETGSYTDPNMTQATYENLVRSRFGNRGAADVLAVYPSTDYPSISAAWTALTTDFQFICPARRTARAAAGAQSQPVHLYVFRKALESARYESLGSFHGLELFYLFQQTDRINGYTPSPDDFALEDDMLSYWTKFAAGDALNGQNGITWPDYNQTLQLHLDLTHPVSVESNLAEQRCDFWDSFSIFGSRFSAAR